MDIKNIYLISNDKIKEDQINKISIQSNDLIVLFNHAYPIKFLKIRDHTNKYLFLNAHSTSFHGYAEAIKYNQYYRKLFLHPGYDTLGNIKFNLVIENLEKIFDVTILSPYINMEIYPEGKRSTIGFIAFIWFQINYPNNPINLVNFTGVDDKGKPISRWKHDYDFEQKFYKKHNINMI